jgi:apolipoprotein N-acyltransferase
MTATRKLSPWPYLLLGALLTIAGHLRWGIEPLAWLAPILWLHALRLRPDARGRIAFASVFVLAWVATLVKIVTVPLPLAGALGFGVPIGAMLMLPYLLWSFGPRRDTLTFPALMAVAETLMHLYSPFGVWGQAANTVTFDLPLLQLASLTGAVGIGFLLNWIAAAVERWWADPDADARRQLAVAIAAMLLAHVWGSARLVRATDEGEPLVTVAAVGSDNLAGLELDPSYARRRAWDELMFERTRIAARAGAELVVWNEAGALVKPEEHEAWLAEVGELARTEQVAIAAAYILPLSLDPLAYENAYVMFGPDGVQQHRYLKHNPVPGEPAVPGTGPAPLWTSEALGEVSGALCYDYDFPANVRERFGVDLVALPSSDWRGIDPIHTEMARLRAIEGGHSVVRSTRWGLSAGIDPTGAVRGQRSHFDGGDRILLMTLPRHGRWTLYGWAGEWFAWLCGLGLVAGCVRWRRAGVSSARDADGAPGRDAGAARRV